MAIGKRGVGTVAGKQREGVWKAERVEMGW
jgi:hypothetical protein